MSIMQRAAKSLLSASALALGVGAVAAPGLTGRRVFAQGVKLAGNAVLRLKPSIYQNLDAGNAEFATGDRKRKPILERRRISELLGRVEAGRLCLDEALARLDIGPAARAEAERLDAEAVFEDLSPQMEVAVQYSGGGDSTLAALLAARHFRRVHLLTGRHTFIGSPGLASVNAQKLAGMYGSDRVMHAYVDTSRPLREMLFGDYWRDLREYGMFPIVEGCLACKMSFDMGMVAYARQHDIGAVLDGADLMIKFQLSQGHPEVMQVREDFYKSHGLQFLHPCAGVSDGATILLLKGLSHDPPALLYPVQPHCRGYDFLGQVTKRFYYLPRHGMDGLTEVGLRFVRDKLGSVRTCEEPCADNNAPGLVCCSMVGDQ